MRKSDRESYSSVESSSLFKRKPVPKKFGLFNRGLSRAGPTFPVLLPSPLKNLRFSRRKGILKPPKTTCRAQPFLN